MIPEVEPRLIFARCVAPALADDPTREHLAEGGDFRKGNHDGGESSAQRKPIRGGAAKLARRLAEVQALRKLVQKAEASRAC
jgi:hypothetical protein